MIYSMYVWSFLFQTTELFEKLAKEEPQSIECKEQAPALDQALKIVLNDSSSESLRIPKVAKRPADFKLISGYTSELRELCFHVTQSRNLIQSPSITL